MPSPPADGSVTMRMSTLWPSIDVEVAHDLHAGDDAGCHAARDRRRLRQHAVDAETHAHVAAVRLEVDVRRAVLHRLGDDRVDELDDRGVGARLAEVDEDVVLLLGVHDLGDGVVEAVHLGDQRCDVLARGHDRAHLVAGHQLEVVEREHVRRVGHRHEQAAGLVEADRDRVEAAGRLRGEQVHGRDVRLVDRQVDVVEAEALGGRLGELLDAESARLDQHVLRRVTGRAALLHGALDALLGNEAELDHDV
jgi:hypothetical protein